MDTTEALIVAEALANQFRGFIRAACAKHARFEPEDVRQNLAVIACETPDAFNVSSPKGQLALIRLAIPSASRPEEWTGNGMRKQCLAERVQSAPLTTRTRVRSAMMARFGTDPRTCPREQLRKAVSLALRTVDPVAMSAPDAPGALEGLTPYDTVQDALGWANSRAPRALTPQVRMPVTGRMVNRFACPSAPSSQGYHPGLVRARRVAKRLRRARARAS